MKLFECQDCGQLLYFENTRCERCKHVLGYLPDRAALSALAPLDGQRWRPLIAPEQRQRFCANAAHDACNWLVPAQGPDTFCQACRLNRTIPDLGPPDHLLRWQRLEAAKHRLVYGLLRLGLPMVSKFENPDAGLAFDFLADPASSFQENPPVVTGHARGLITINIAEADDAERERVRQDMGEPYRTLLGHFRHEVGHYYWDRLVRDGVWLDAFRTMFGDDRQDYGTCLEAHHAEGPPPDWQQRFVSGYASAHPWEDFAETWAHYLHIVDTLETAAFGLRLDPEAGHDPALAMAIDFDPYRERDFDALLKAWLPLTYAVNSLNQSMGQPDLYRSSWRRRSWASYASFTAWFTERAPEAGCGQVQKLCRRRQGELSCSNGHSWRSECHNVLQSAWHAFACSPPSLESSRSQGKIRRRISS